VKYTDQQTATGGSNLNPPNPELAVVVVNSGDLEAKGFEFEGDIIPVDGMTLTYGVGYTSAHYAFVNPLLLPTGSTWYPPIERPRITANMAAEYDSKPVWNEAYVMARLDANFRSQQFLSQFQPTGNGPLDVTEAGTVAKGAWVVSGRLALSHIVLPAGNAELALWCRNILDNRTPEYGVGTPFVGSLYWGRARAFGVDLTYDF
jgi:iron complex outermembrane receptor protein